MEAVTAEHKEATARLKLAEANLKRVKNLYESEILSEQQMDSTAAEFAAWTGRVEKLEADRARIQNDVDQATIRAPFTGVVVEEHTETEPTTCSSPKPPRPRLSHVDSVSSTPSFRERSLFLQAPGSKIRTFVTGCIGTTKFSPTDQAIADANASEPTDEFIDDPADLTSESKFGFNFGGGVETKITSKLGIRFDFRDYLTSIPTFGVPTTDPGTGADFYPVDGSIHNFSTSIGFVFFLD